ncbi:MAG: SH3 domain-containing protein [Aggregatilineales bacterium]
MKYQIKRLLWGVMLSILFGSFTFGASVFAIEESQQSQFTAPILVANTSFLNVRTGPGIQYTTLVTIVGGTELPVLGVARDRVWYQVSTIVGVGWVNVQFTLPRGDFTNVPFAQEPTSAPMEFDTLMAQTAQGDATGTVNFSSGLEWGISVVVGHPFRSNPALGAGSSGTIGATPDRIYIVYEAISAEGTTWYRIDDPTFGIGWVESGKVAFRPFACELSAVVFTASAAPGAGPDGSGSLTGEVRVNQGAEAYLLDARNEQFKVSLLDGSTGWVPSSVAAVRGDVFSNYCASGGSIVANASTTTTNGTTATGTTSTQPRFAGPRAVINTGFLNLRSGPGAQYSVVTTLAGGTEVPLIGVANDGVWYLVQGTFGRAWLNSEFVLFRGDGSRLPIIRDFSGSVFSAPVAVITNAVTLYASPNVGANVIGAVSGPAEASIVARTSNSTWVQISTSIGFGWVQVTSITLQGDTSLIPVVNG